MDGSRGLLLILGFCIVQVHSQNNVSRESYNCVYVETIYQLMKDSVHKSSCVQSQLTDASRFKLTQVFDLYRADVSKGYFNVPADHLTPRSNVFKMNYHWICEFIGAYIINHNLPMTSPVEKSTITEMATYFAITSDYGHDQTIMGTVDVIKEYNITIYEIQINKVVNSQAELLKELTENYRQYLNGRSLESKQGEIRVWPGTSYFGCVIYIKDGKKPDSKNLNCLLCVFATDGEADQDFKEGIMDNTTCASSKPQGVFDSEKNLCVDKKILDKASAAKKNMPCQFFYNSEILRDRLPQICDGIDPEKYPDLKESPEGFPTMEINFHDTPIPVPLPVGDSREATETTPLPSKKGGALKLHSIQIYLVVSIALISSTFSQLFSSCT